MANHLAAAVPALTGAGTPPDEAVVSYERAITRLRGLVRTARRMAAVWAEATTEEFKRLKHRFERETEIYAHDLLRVLRELGVDDDFEAGVAQSPDPPGQVYILGVLDTARPRAAGHGLSTEAFSALRRITLLAPALRVEFRELTDAVARGDAAAYKPLSEGLYRDLDRARDLAGRIDEDRLQRATKRFLDRQTAALDSFLGNLDEAEVEKRFNAGARAIESWIKIVATSLDAQQAKRYRQEIPRLLKRDAG
jgi:hypothetical protein